MEPIYTKGDVNIYKITENVYFRQIDFRKTQQCNSVFFVGKDAVAVVDVANEEAAKQLREEALALFGKEITTVFLTHPHFDHVDGLPYFLEGTKTVYASRFLYNFLDEKSKNSGATFVAVDQKLTIFFSSLELELVLPPGGVMHCPGEMFIRVKKDGIVAAGDSVNSEFREFYCDEGNLKNWLYGLDHYFEPNDKLILPGHGMPYEAKYLCIVRDNINLTIKVAKEIYSSLSPQEKETLSKTNILEKIRTYLSTGSEEALRLIKICKGQEEAILEMVFWKFLHE